MRSPRLLASVLPLVLAASACPDRASEAPPTPIEFETGRVRVATEADTFPLAVELAATDAQRQRGLMYRDSLAEDAGMLFLYDAEQTADHGFWMYHTRIPLDIAFLDADGRIVAIRAMEPCPSPYSVDCPGYPPGAPWRNALEVNAGWFGRRGVAVGDRVILPGGAAGEAEPPGEGAPGG